MQNFSLKDNIAIGNLEDENNLEFIKESAEKAGINTFIDTLPEGIETLLSRDFENGTDLSGGQWQKVGIARALFANPKLVILDEPTSALDALAEARVFEEISHLAKDTTMIIVSHRFATVRNADRIIVLDEGKIIESGSHEELMNTTGLYNEMFTKQAEGYK
ncbi:MAG: ATP-binding cassette domain-containing protein [Candidatus Dojkabacteria bacterium]|nr:ATP-binding cassette domain-containing protein [Candidatus Dojkabacteria bacterium]MDQ7020359.1 ATP-binding cassette domain-containing protein [Candidatus Dojkabacteria bacterium]